MFEGHRDRVEIVPRATLDDPPGGPSCSLEHVMVVHELGNETYREAAEPRDGGGPEGRAQRQQVIFAEGFSEAVLPDKIGIADIIG